MDISNLKNYLGIWEDRQTNHSAASRVYSSCIASAIRVCNSSPWSEASCSHRWVWRNSEARMMQKCWEIATSKPGRGCRRTSTMAHLIVSSCSCELRFLDSAAPSAWYRMWSTLGSLKYGSSTRIIAYRAVSPFQPKHRLGHPENYLFLLSKNTFIGSKYPKMK